MLPAGIFIFLQSTLVQTYLAHRISEYLSQKLNTKVYIEKADIRFFMNVVLKNVYIADQHNNPLLVSRKMQVHLEDFDIKSNYFELKKIVLEDTYFNLRKYKNDDKTNLQFILDFFKSDNKKSYDYPLKLKIKDLIISNSGFSFSDENKKHNSTIVDFTDIALSHLNIRMKNITIVQDSVAAEIKNLALDEKSGFAIHNFSAKTIVSKRNIVVNDLKITTPHSKLDLDLAFRYQGFHDFNDFLNKVYIASEIRPSVLNTIDIAAFVAAMHGMNNKVLLSAHINGKVSNFKAKNLLLNYGKSTFLSGDFTLNGLPNIKETYFKLKFRNFTTSLSDLNSIIIPAPEQKTTHLNLPPILKRMGNICVKGNLTGFYTNFVSNATLKTDIGTVITDVLINNNNGNFSYNGKVKTENLNLGLFVQSQEDVGKISLDAQIQGSGITAASASFQLQGNIQLIELKKYPYRGITLNGSLDKKVFNGDFSVQDPNLVMDFHGRLDLNDSLPRYNFSADIDYADLKKLNILPKDSVSEVKGLLNINFTGTNIDNIKGTISLEKAHFRKNEKYFQLKSFVLETNIQNNGYRVFNLKSDYVDAVFKGFFVFAELPKSFRYFAKNYLPEINIKTDTSVFAAKQHFDFDISLYNATPVLRFFVPEISTAGNTILKGTFNSANNTLQLKAASSDIAYKKFHFRHWNLNATAGEGLVTLTMSADTFNISDSVRLPNFLVNSRILYDSVKTNITWDNHKMQDRNLADISFYTCFQKPKRTVFGFKDSKIMIDDSLWFFDNKAMVIIDSSVFTMNNLKIYRSSQSFVVDGRISKDPFDVITLKFNDFDLSNLDFLTNIKKFDFDGIANGVVNASQLYTSPSFFADLYVKNFGVNGDKLGDAIIKTLWDDFKKAIQVEAEVDYIGSVGIARPFIITGYYYPTSKKQNLDFTMFIDNLRLKALSRYVATFGSVVAGTASGILYLRGLASDPELSGSLKAMRTMMRINYLNTAYAFAHDSVKLSKNSISFKDVVLIDQYNGDTAWMTGAITHHKFKNIAFDIFIKTKNTLCLNTNAVMNDVFYGKAFATGTAHIYGDPNNINFDISARTNKGTEIYIPVGNSSSLTTNDYISFVSKEKTEQIHEDKGRFLKGMNLDMSVDVTDDAEIQLLFDPRAGDRIRGQGNGNIRMNYVSGGDFKMFGDYVLTSGDYLFTFQNIINKRFSIDPGSTVKWNGDPYNAELDITARYKLKANLAGLGVDTNSRYVPVECVIHIKNILANPEFTFEVDLPSMADYEKAPYLAVINQNLNNNFISLLVINSFVGPNTGITQTATSGVTMIGKSASEVLSNQLSNWLSQISKSVNIGINYRPGDNISQEEVEVALSTQLFNDRVSISSNLGVATGQTNINNKSTNQIVGDVEIEVKLTKALKLRVYNFTNHNDILQYNSPYTQGLGVMYRREFNTYKDLFKRKKPKIKNN